MHLRYDLMGAHFAQEVRHAQVVMRSLGLTYQKSTPQSMGDQWWFWNVEGDTSNLPKFISELDVDPWKCVGFGLSEQDAKEIAEYKKS